MTWFKIDDSFHSHPKVLAADPAALGLWVVAGAWCSANLTDGFVPDYALTRLLPDAKPLAEQLVSCRLWKRAKGGYRFHDWADYNPTAESVKDERRAARERMKNLRATRKKTSEKPPTEIRTSGVANPETAGQDPDCSGEHEANVRDMFVTPTRPVLSSSNEELTQHSSSVGGARPRPTPGTRIPDDFAIDETLRAWAKAETPDAIVELETAQFVDHWRAASGATAVKRDWRAAWRKWMRNRQQWNSERNARPALSVVGRPTHQPYREDEDRRNDLEYWSKGL